MGDNFCPRDPTLWWRFSTHWAHLSPVMQLVLLPACFVPGLCVDSSCCLLSQKKKKNSSCLGMGTCAAAAHTLASPPVAALGKNSKCWSNAVASQGLLLSLTCTVLLVVLLSLISTWIHVLVSWAVEHFAAAISVCSTAAACCPVCP